MSGRFTIRQGHVCWVDLGAPAPGSSQPAKRRPVVVVQADRFNLSAWRTVIVVPLTSNLKHAERPHNQLVSARTSGLPTDSVALTLQPLTVDKGALDYPVGMLPPGVLAAIIDGIHTVMTD